MTAMTDTTTPQQLEERLHAEEQRIVSEIARLSGGKTLAADDALPVEYPDYGSKEDENAAEVATLSDELSLEQKLEESLSDVRSALDRMKKGTYGMCRYCGKPIDPRRLAARPESSSCVSCKEQLKTLA